LFDETVSRLEAISPPDEYVAGHEVVLAYFKALADTSDQIGTAIAAGDLEEMRLQMERSGTIAQETDESLPSNIRILLSPLFQP